MAEGSEHVAGVLEARYANSFQVGHNEYEFIFDFSQFHPGHFGDASDAPQVPIVRIVMGPPFAKALLDTLRRAVTEYEQVHGTIEHG
jgi:hypothetical protein